MLKLGEFPFTYDDIIAATKRLSMENYNDLVESAHSVRQGAGYNSNDLFRNISFINQCVVPALQKEFDTSNNGILVK